MSAPASRGESRRRIGPFAVFGAVGAVAALGAIYEISYWVGVPAFASSVEGTTAGIIAAVIAFFVFGLLAPANE